MTPRDCLGCRRPLPGVSTAVDMVLCIDCTEELDDWWASRLISGWDAGSLHAWEEAGPALRAYFRDLDCVECGVWSGPTAVPDGTVIRGLDGGAIKTTARNFTCRPATTIWHDRKPFCSPGCVDRFLAQARAYADRDRSMDVQTSTGTGELSVECLTE